MIDSLCRFAFGSCFSWLSSSGKISRARSLSLMPRFPPAPYSISQHCRCTRCYLRNTLRSQHPTRFCGVAGCLVSCSQPDHLNLPHSPPSRHKSCTLQPRVFSPILSFLFSLLSSVLGTTQLQMSITSLKVSLARPCIQSTSPIPSVTQAALSVP